MYLYAVLNDRPALGIIASMLSHMRATIVGDKHLVAWRKIPGIHLRLWPTAGQPLLLVDVLVCLGDAGLRVVLVLPLGNPNKLIPYLFLPGCQLLPGPCLFYDGADARLTSLVQDRILVFKPVGVGRLHAIPPARLHHVPAVAVHVRELPSAARLALIHLALNHGKLLLDLVGQYGVLERLLNLFLSRLALLCRGIFFRALPGKNRLFSRYGTSVPGYG